MIEKIQVKVINNSGFPLPARSTPGSAGLDVHACIEKDIVIPPMGRALVPTGLKMQMPCGYECQIRPRSGLALRHGITVLNTPGTVDADSRAEIGVILINLSSENFTVSNGDRICQMVFKKCVDIEWLEVTEIDRTQREDGRFGDTGYEPEFSHPGEDPACL